MADWRYGNVQGLVRTSNDHIIFLPNPLCARTKAPRMSLQTIGSRKVQQQVHLSVFCAAENMTSPVLFDHYIRIFYSATKLQTQSGHRVGECAQIDMHSHSGGN